MVHGTPCGSSPLKTPIIILLRPVEKTCYSSFLLNGSFIYLSLMSYYASVKYFVSYFLRNHLAWIAIIISGIFILFVILAYNVSWPKADMEELDPTKYLFTYEEVAIPSSEGWNISAWWIPGLENAPGIILSPGYGMSRTDALSIASVLNPYGFNILIYSPRGSFSMSNRAASLGLREVGDMADAIRFLKDRPESDPSRIGIWGVDESAFAALQAAVDFQEVRAIVADSPFLTVREYLNYRLSEDYKIENRFSKFACYKIFRLIHIFDGEPQIERLTPEALSGKSILFIKGESHPMLAAATSAVYDRIRPAKEIFSIETTRVHSMSGDMLRTYDARVAEFFYENLTSEVIAEAAKNAVAGNPQP